MPDKPPSKPARATRPCRKEHRASTGGLRSIHGLHGASHRRLVESNLGIQGGAGASGSVREGEADRSFSLGRELARAKDAQEVLTLQSQFMQAQMQSYLVQTQELGQLMSEA